MIAVYGANGFIGRHLVLRLIGAGHSVRAVSRRFDPEFDAEIKRKSDIVVADLGQPLAMASSLQDVSTVVQLVSSSSPGLRNDHAMADITENLVPHVEFLQTCARAGVKRYIFLSSGGTVYGPGASVPTPETAPTNPINSHGLTKLFVEKYIQMHGHMDGLEYFILRVANPFGPGQIFRKGQGLVPAIIDRWQKQQPVRIFGTGEARRDFIYIDDVIDAIEAAIGLPGSPQLVLNIGGGETKSVNEVVDAIEAAAGAIFQREYVPSRSTDVDISGLDISLAHQTLRWVPRTDFREAMRLTVEYYLTRPAIIVGAFAKI